MNRSVRASAKVARIVREANRSEIARRTGIHLSHVSRVLSGKRTASAANLADIAAALNVSMVDLYAHLVQVRLDWVSKSARNQRAGRRTGSLTAA